MENVNIIKLIEKNPVTRLSKEYENKFLTRIKETFNENQQKLFVASFYCFLSYDSKSDFVVDFDNVWKWLGFSRKDPAKRLLEKCFTEHIDYQVNKLAAPNVAANKIPPLSGGAAFEREDKVKNLGGSGINKEQIMLTVNTFKKFCLKAETKKADEVHDYYIKLEELLQKTVNEETNELRYQLENKEKEIENNIQELRTKKHELEMSQKNVEKLNKKIKQKYRTKYELTHSVYIISNIFFPDYFKLGKSSTINTRIRNYVSGSPVDYKIEFLQKVRNKSEETAIETMVLIILDKYRVDNHLGQPREWVHGVDLETIKTEITRCIDFMNTNRQKYGNIDLENEETGIEEKNLVENKINLVFEEGEEKDEENIEEEKTDEEEKKTKNNTPKKVKITRYDVGEEELGIVRNDPTKFNQFIDDCCDKGELLYEIQSDIRCMYRIWSRCMLDTIQTDFDTYMNSNYKDNRIFIDNQRRHVYMGISLKPLVYKKTRQNFDFEQFIESKCEVNYLHRISYLDFFYFFEKWMKETDPSFEVGRYDRVKIQEILERTFAKGRILHSVRSKTKNLWGILGVGMEENNFGLIEKKRQNKKVGEFDATTHEMIKEYDSIHYGSEVLSIPFSSFGMIIRLQTIVNGKYYKLL